MTFKVPSNPTCSMILQIKFTQNSMSFEFLKGKERVGRVRPGHVGPVAPSDSRGMLGTRHSPAARVAPRPLPNPTLLSALTAPGINCSFFCSLQLSHISELFSAWQSFGESELILLPALL